MSFDGSEFRGLDTQVVDESFDRDQPLDVFLEQSLASNGRYLARGYDQAAIPLIGATSSTSTGSEVERRWASVNKSRIFAYPIVLTYGVESVTHTMSYTCDVVGTSGTGVDVEWRIVKWDADFAEDFTVLASSSTKFTSATTLTGHEETVALDGPWLQRDTAVWLEVWIQSDLGDDSGVNYAIQEDQSQNRKIKATSTTTDFSGFPRVAFVSDDTGAQYDVITGQGQYFYVYPTWSSNDTTLSVFQIWYLEIRGASVRVNFEKRIAAQVPSVIELRAQEPVFSTTSVPQFAAARRAYKRERHIAFGPRGEKTPSEGVDAPNFYFWPRSPLNEVHIDGLLRDGETGEENFLLRVAWLADVAEGGKLETTIDATLSVFDSGDTSWSDATIVASASETGTFFYKGDTIRGSTPLLAAEGRSSSITDPFVRDSQIFGDDVYTIKETSIVLNTNANFDATAHDKPFRLELDIDVSKGLFNTDGTEFFADVYIVGYSIIARGAL